MGELKLGDVVRIALGNDTILAGQGAVVLSHDEDGQVWLVTNGGFAGADYPLRHVIPASEVVPYA